jgi:hypothetical protein
MDLIALFLIGIPGIATYLKVERVAEQQMRFFSPKETSVHLDLKHSDAHDGSVRVSYS